MNDAAIALVLRDDVVAAAAGDHVAFGRLVDATRSVVASIALAILRDSEASADVAQDVFISAWTGLSKLKDPTSFLPWIRQLARNRAHHALRSRVRFGKRITNRDVDDILAAAADPRPDAIEQIVAAEESTALAAALDALPSSAREIVILYYREGQSVRQVASLLGMSDDAVKQRLSRSRSRLRESLIRRLADTAPTAAFTAGVLTAISFAAPPTAAAATVRAAKTAGGGTLAAKILTVGSSASAFAGAAGGLLAGGASIVLRTRGLVRLARDDDERRGIMRWSSVTMLTMIGFMSIIISMPRPLPVTIAFAGMAMIFVWCHLVWLPRITSRRYAAELSEDPSGAAQRQRTQRRQALLSCLIGLAIGGTTVAAMWIL